MTKRALILFALLVLTIIRSHAQTCSGSKGDPVVTLDFGSGPGPGAPLTGKIIPDYRYTGSSCPKEGEYTIASSSSFCFNNTWTFLFTDHTLGDQNGYFLLVNGGTKGPFYTETIANLCSNRTYRVGAYLINMMRAPECGTSFLPKVGFSIQQTDGTVLATYNSNSLLEGGNWAETAFTFTTPPGVTTVNLVISSLNFGDCGNDFGIDDITFSPCGPLISAGFSTTNLDKIEMCTSNPKVFTMQGTVAAGFSTPYYQWQIKGGDYTSWTDIPGATSINYSGLPPGTAIYNYRLLVNDGSPPAGSKCAINSSQLTVEMDPGPSSQVTNYQHGCYGSNIEMFAAGGESYLWSGPNGFTSNLQEPTIKNIQFTDAGLYKVLVSTHTGCAALDSIYLEVVAAPKASVSFTDTTVCEGTPVQLNAFGSIRYNWLPAKYVDHDTIANPIATVTENTRFLVRVFNENTCMDTASVTINVWKKPMADAGPDKRVKLGNAVQVTGKAGGTNVSYYWTPPNYLDNPNSLNPVSSTPQDMVYSLHVVSNLGCGTMVDEVRVRVFEKVVIPNTFTPNGDGTNDTWVIQDLDVFTDAILEVYNTAGQRVYRSVGYEKPWDGTMNGRPLPVGTYYYAINLKDTRTKPLVGYVTILR